MKKIMGLLLMMGLIVSFGGCGDKGPQGQTLEVYTEKYDNGNIKVELQYYRDGNGEKKHGYYKEYGEDGQIEIESTYKEDKFDGEYIKYDEDGNIVIEGQYKDGGIVEIEYHLFQTRPQGKTLEVDTKEYDNGNIKAEFQFYRDGGKKTKHGYYKGYNGQGRISNEGNYKAGVMDGKWVEYYESGKIKEEGNWKNGEKNGRWVEYYESGKMKWERNWKNGSVWGGVEYYESGQISSEGNRVDGLKNGEKNGRWVEYYENGQIKSMGTYRPWRSKVTPAQLAKETWLDALAEFRQKGKGVKDGSWIYYDKDGKERKVIYKQGEVWEGKKFIDWGKRSKNIRMEENYKEGKRDGKSVEYYESGKIKEEGNWKNGEMDGKSVEYYESGQIRYKGNYKDGKADGKVVGYDEEGNITAEWCYEMGKEVDCPDDE